MPIQTGTTSFQGDIYHDGGNMGIGTDSPDAKLHIEDDYRVTNPPAIPNIPLMKVVGFDGLSTYTVVKVTPGGRVGIGTDNPNTTLDVNGNTGITGDMTVTGNTAITGNTTVTGLTNLNGNTSITGITSIHGSIGVHNNLNVTGNTTMYGFLFAKNDVHIINSGLVFKTDDGVNPPVNELALYPDGKIQAREVYVDLNNISFPDYVFAPDYKLLPLDKLQVFITENKHLPNIKSAEEYEAEGSMSLGEMNLILLEKVEELTLYILAQQEQIKALEIKVNKLKN